MRKSEIINKINEMYSNKDEIEMLMRYVDENIAILNKYKSLYPIIGESGNIFMKYIPTKTEYLEFEEANKYYMNLAAIKCNRDKFNC